MKMNKKIILFTDSLGSGGAQRQLVGLAVMLNEKGYDVKVATYFSQDFYKSDLDENGVQNEIIPGADNTKRRIFAVRSYFHSESPDWVIAYQETPSIVACAAKVLGCKYKLLVSERNTTQVVGMNERIRFCLYRWADAIVPNSYAQEKWLSMHHPWMVKKITAITNFVDLEKFNFVDHQRNAKPLILVAASAMHSKNVLGFIRAAKILTDKGLKFHIVWYGLVGEETDYHRECFDLIRNLGISESFHLLPKTKEIHKKYQEADYFCLPSFYEGTPNVICESISTGLPVICSNVCDNPHYVEEGRNGVLFDPRSPEDMADKVMQLIRQSEEEYQSFRKNSRIVAEQKLSADVFINKYLNILRNESKK